MATAKRRKKAASKKHASRKSRKGATPKSPKAKPAKKSAPAKKFTRAEKRARKDYAAKILLLRKHTAQEVVDAVNARFPKMRPPFRVKRVYWLLGELREGTREGFKKSAELKLKPAGTGNGTPTVKPVVRRDPKVNLVDAYLYLFDNGPQHALDIAIGIGMKMSYAHVVHNALGRLAKLKLAKNNADGWSLADSYSDISRDEAKKKIEKALAG